MADEPSSRSRRLPQSTATPQPAPAVTAAPAVGTRKSSRHALRQAPNTPVCAGCHEDKWTSTALSAHGAKNDAQGSMCQAMSTADLPPSTSRIPGRRPSPRITFSRLTPATASDQSNVFASRVTRATVRPAHILGVWQAAPSRTSPAPTAHSIHDKERTTPVAPCHDGRLHIPNEIADTCKLCMPCAAESARRSPKPSHPHDHRRQDGEVLGLPQLPHRALSPVITRAASSPISMLQCTSCHIDNATRSSSRTRRVVRKLPVLPQPARLRAPHG